MFIMKMFVGRTQFEQFWIEQKQPIILIYIPWPKKNRHFSL